MQGKGGYFRMHSASLSNNYAMMDRNGHGDSPPGEMYEFGVAKSLGNVVCVCVEYHVASATSPSLSRLDLCASSLDRSNLCTRALGG